MMADGYPLDVLEKDIHELCFITNYHLLNRIDHIGEPDSEFNNYFADYSDLDSSSCQKNCQESSYRRFPSIHNNSGSKS